METVVKSPAERSTVFGAAYAGTARFPNRIREWKPICSTHTHRHSAARGGRSTGHGHRISRIGRLLPEDWTRPMWVMRLHLFGRGVWMRVPVSSRAPEEKMKCGCGHSFAPHSKEASCCAR